MAEVDNTTDNATLQSNNIIEQQIAGPDTVQNIVEPTNTMDQLQQAQDQLETVAQEEEEIEPVFEGNNPEDDLISLIMQSTALPQNCDTQFAFITGASPVKSYERPPALLTTLRVMLAKINNNDTLLRQLSTAMANEGNFIDMQCELIRQQQLASNDPLYALWQSIATSILNFTRNNRFYFNRIYISQNPFQEVKGMTREAAIDNAKRDMAIAAGASNPYLDVSMISWDTVSYKTLPMGVEYFCKLNPGAIHWLTNESCGIINQLEQEVKQTIRIALSDYRAQTETRSDPLIDDYSVFLESRVAPIEFNQQRAESIRNMGDNVLIQYVRTMKEIFAAGLIPGTILPSKIFACQDVVSAVELRAAIKLLAEQQILQLAEKLENANVRIAAERQAEQAIQQKKDLLNNWTVKQVQSLEQARLIDSTYTLGMKSFGERPYQDQRDTTQQLAGGANSLKDQLDMQMSGSVVRFTEESRELLRQSLSLLLACLRIRFDSIQASKFELVTQEDVDHLEICKKLAGYLDPDGQLLIRDLATTVQELQINAHNNTKLYQLQLPGDAILNIEYQVKGKAQVILKAIPFFDADMQESGSHFTSLVNCLYLSLCEHNRVATETEERLARRSAIFTAINQYRQ